MSNMPQQTQLNIAIIGTGHIGPRHATSVAKSPSAQLTCFVDPSPHASAIAAAFNVPIFPSIKDMLSKELRPDACIVCTPNSTHVTIAEELLLAGIHVLVEKPISTTVASGQHLVDVAREAGKCLLVGHHRRFNPFIVAAKRALDDGTIGRPIAISGIWATYKPATYFEAPAEWRRKAGNGGPILINLIHEVDCLQFLLGPIVRVYAEQTPSHRGFEVEEGAAIVLRFASGVVGTFVLSDASPSAHFFEAATGENPIVPKLGKDIYRVFGSEGTLSVGDMTVERHGEGEEKSWSSEVVSRHVPVGEEVPFDEQVEHFVRVVRGAEEPRCTGADGLSAVVVCDAVRRSMVEGRPIEIPFPSRKGEVDP